MHDEIGRFDWRLKLTEVYRAVVGRADAATGMERQAALDEAVPVVVSMIAAGDLALPVADLVRVALTNTDEAEGESVSKVLKKLADGRDPLPLSDDPMLDVVVTLGEGRRKPWRHVTVQDLREMDSIRNKNRIRVEEAYQEDSKRLQKLAAAIEPHGTIGAAIQAGALLG